MTKARGQFDRSTGDLVDDLFAAMRGKNYVDGAIIAPRLNGKYPREWNFIRKTACRGRKMAVWNKLSAAIKQGCSPVGIVVVDSKGLLSVTPFKEYESDEVLYNWLNLMSKILRETHSQGADGLPDQLLLPDDKPVT